MASRRLVAQYRIKIPFLVFVLYVFLSLPILMASGQEEEWRKFNGTHFIVYFTQNEKFAKEVLDKAEVYYRNIAVNLGYPRYSKFWLWGKRVRIYVYPDREKFLKATSQPYWSEGMADYKNRKIVSYAWSKGFLESLLPHEMAHLIFRDFVGFKGEIPLWLDEGVAQWEEEAKRTEMKSMIKQLYDKDQLMMVNDMMKLDIARMKEKDRIYIRPTRTKEGEVAVLFLSTENLVRTYYLQSVSLVGFLIEEYGSTKFSEFCRQLRDEKTIEEALRGAYLPQINDLTELEDRWREYLEKGV